MPPAGDRNGLGSERFMLPGVDAEPRFQTSPPEPVTVAFSARNGTVSGMVSTPESSPRPFHGWLELMDELERLRSSAPRVPR
jgi:hypothetical protein